MLEKRELERSILGGIDRLVQVLIEISSTTGAQKTILMEQAVQMVRDLSPLLMQLLGGQEEHLEGLLRQLISQKLPPNLALLSFGPFKQDLDQVLASAYFYEPEIPLEEAPISESVTQEISAEEDNSVLELEVATEQEQAETPSPRVILYQILNRLYPQSSILPGCYYRSIFLDYYLPDKKLAFILMQPGCRILPTLEKLINKEGLTLIKVQPSELDNPSLLARRLKST